eukprot:scaffold64650_cov18-Tisochrysis_lutea.AAC.1
MGSYSAAGHVPTQSLLLLAVTRPDHGWGSYAASTSMPTTCCQHDAHCRELHLLLGLVECRSCITFAK